MRARWPTLAIAVTVVAVAAACDDDGAGGGGGGVQAYCDFAAELDAQEGNPSDEQLDRIRELAPDEISDDVDVLADTIEEGDPQAFEDPEVRDSVESLEDFEAENCG